MNRFKVYSCVEFKEDGYEGPVVILSCASDPSFMLFFPILSEQGHVINHVLKAEEEDDEYNVNSNVLGIYKTMLDSWRASDRYLSGIIMDVVYDNEVKEDVLSIQLALSANDGSLDSLVQVSFLHSILLAAMDEVEIIVSDKFLSEMMPAESMTNKYPDFQESLGPRGFKEDQETMNIARKIMSGKIKNKDKDQEDKEEK